MERAERSNLRVPFSAVSTKNTEQHSEPSRDRRDLAVCVLHILKFAHLPEEDAGRHCSTRQQAGDNARPVQPGRDGSSRAASESLFVVGETRRSVRFCFLGRLRVRFLPGFRLRTRFRFRFRFRRRFRCRGDILSADFSKFTVITCLYLDFGFGRWPKYQYQFC